MACAEEEDLLVDTEDESLEKLEQETEYITSEDVPTNSKVFLKMEICDDNEEDEDYEDGEIQTYSGNMSSRRRFIREVRQSRYCTTATYIVLLILLIVSSVTVVVFVVLLIVPYARVAHFRPATCNVTSATEHVAEGMCACEEECELLIPCLVVHVTYTLTETVTETETEGDTAEAANNESIQTAMLYENEMVLGLKCSFYPSCKSEHAGSLDEVNEFRKGYGVPSKSFPCFYNPHRYDEVIRSHRFSLHHVLHASIWSCAALLAAIVLLALTLRTRGCF